MPTTTRTNLTFLLPLVAISAIGLSAAAQAPAADGTSYMQSQPAPIERSQTQGQTPSQQATRAANRPAVKTSQPAQGVYVRVTPQGSITTVASTPGHTELRVDSGIVNISVHHPEHDSLILVDLGSGQLDLMKDGFYTFNADTKTARVLLGEAEAYPSADAGAKPVKVKEDHSITFGTGELRSVSFEPFQARTDVLPRDSAAANGDGRPAYRGYGFEPYGYGYGYPYYAWGYPGYGWGYPYGFGVGFGYYGGFYGGGFGGFRGRR